MATDGIQTESVPTTIPDNLAGNLPEDIASCHEMIRLQNQVQLQLLEQLENNNRKIMHMEHQLQQLLRRLYGRSSEKFDPSELPLFGDGMMELPATEEPEIETTESQAQAHIPKPHVVKGHGRRKLPDDLPRERVVHDLADDEKPCPCCGEMRAVIGEVVSEQLDYIPAKFSVIENVRLKYGCKVCESKAAIDGPQIEVADKPMSPIEKCLAAPGLLAHVIVSKYNDHLPLHRLEDILIRNGLEIPRSTQCDWMRQSADALIPLYDIMAADVLKSKVIHTDDTPVDVQNLGGESRGKLKKGRFWVYVGDDDHPQTVFDFTPNRGRDGPVEFIGDWGKDAKVFLQADAYAGYNCIFDDDDRNVVEVACWAHARRKFYDAQKSARLLCAEVLARIKLLYDVERKATEQFKAQIESEDKPLRPLAEIRLELRQAKSVGILNKLEPWLKKQLATIMPKSPIALAITYTLNQFDALKVYTTDGNLAIDNNLAENSLRRIALGRKNWLFVGSDRGGRTAAVLFSIIATCKRHNIEPLSYIRDILTRIPAHQHNKLHELLPANWQSQS